MLTCDGSMLAATSYASGSQGICQTGYSAPYTISDPQIEIVNYYDNYGFIGHHLTNAMPTVSIDTNQEQYATGSLMGQVVYATNGSVTRYIYSAAGEKLRVIYLTAVPNITVPIGSVRELAPSGIQCADSTDYLLGGGLSLRNGRVDKLQFDDYDAGS